MRIATMPGKIFFMIDFPLPPRGSVDTCAVLGNKMRNGLWPFLNCSREYNDRIAVVYDPFTASSGAELGAYATICIPEDR